MRIGVLGGGQLGRMLALAGIPLGSSFTFLDPAPDACAGQVGELVVGAYDDPRALATLTAASDVVTYEFENVPAAAVRALRDIPVYPSVAALDTAQDRVAEKRLFSDLGFPVAPYAPAATPGEVTDALDRIGHPAVVKTRRGGYDGKGQVVVTEAAEGAGAWEALGEVPLIVESFVDFDRELSVIAVRARDGSMVAYPLVENDHRDGILRMSVAPAPGLDPSLQAAAEKHAGAVMDELEHVGVLAIEMFERNGELLANEMAPRVHNSGHWTIDGAATSQFENHLRAITGLPFGGTGARGHCAMVNIVGEMIDPVAVLSVPGAHLHLYGKAPRPGRKIGHVTIVADDEQELAARVERLHARS